ncbi:MAG: aconitase X catalytic domain-containing protein [Anaerolineae bacterium]
MVELTDEEQDMLHGGFGPGVGKAMEIIVALGQVYDAQRLVPVSSAQVAGVSYRNLGRAGLEFLREWADQGARARVPATLNPAGIDLRAWRELGFSEDFASGQMAVVEAYEALGVRPTCTCTPYAVGNRPRAGQHVAWAESSAVSYANSVVGARTNREGAPSAMAAAIAGRTAAYGLHLDSNRRASLRVEVQCPVRSLSDFGALGYLVGKEAWSQVPYFEGLDPCTNAELKALGAAMAASGAVALFHVGGVTPEAGRPDILATNHRTIVVGDLEAAYFTLNSEARGIDLVWFGCPHAELDEIACVARLLDGRRVTADLWITTARSTRETAARKGLVDLVEAAGGRVIADMCVVVAPMHELDYHTLATPSAKGATYVPSLGGLLVRYGTIEQCVEAAVTGAWAA